MTNLQKLRTLIWDEDSKVFSDSTLNNWLEVTGNNVYKAAIAILSHPDTVISYRIGGRSKVLQGVDKAIERYERMSGGYTIITGSSKRVY